jgi:hypothetical protein
VSGSTGAPHNNKMQRTKPGQDGASPLILVFSGRKGFASTRTITVISCLTVASLVFALSTDSTAEQPRISRNDARALVMAALQDKKVDVASPQFGLEDRPDMNEFPGWYQFDAYFDTPLIYHRSGGYGVFGATSEVWQEEPCRRLNGNRVRKLRMSLMTRYGLKTTRSSQRPFCPID